MEQKVLCKVCKKTFVVKRPYYKKGKKIIPRYCSQKCRAKEIMGCFQYWKGKKRSLETRLKQRLSTQGPKCWKWKGNEKVDSEGYVRVWCPNHPHRNHRNMVRKHKLVLEKYLGVIIPRNLEIHHIDKNKQNNSVSNLMLFSSKSAHIRFEFGKSKVHKEEILFDGRKYATRN